MDTLEKALKGVHAALQGLTPGERMQVLDFVVHDRVVDEVATPRADLTWPELQSAWKQDQDDRAAAAAIQEHRKNRVLSEIEEMFGEGAVQNVVAALGGVGATAELGTPGARIDVETGSRNRKK